MNANYLFDLCNYNDTVTHAPGLDIALAMYVVEHPLPDGMTEEGTVHFITDHYDKLVRAFDRHDREHFTRVVNECIKLDCTNRMA